MAVEVGAARQRIIRRPRLTSMLDESPVQIRLLVAPAGYGKTTLAREWLGNPERRGVWYRGGPASADVAALAAGIAEATSEIVPDAGRRMRDRLHATGHPEEDVDILAELFAEDVQDWPEDVWLAFDDYHFAMGSVASERFVDLLIHETPIQMLITSRRRPSWASARRILYGEILEIDRQALAMEDAEAREVLGRRDDPEIVDLLEGARGWPAVIGLVALSSNIGVARQSLPDQLYDYFAQELYGALPEADRVPIAELSFAGRFDRSLAASALGAKADRTIEAGKRSGIFTEPSRNCFEIHPLLSELVQEQAFPDPSARREGAERIGRLLLRIGRWDDGFDLASRFELRALLVAAVEQALEELIDLGRLATVTRWLFTASSLRCQSPILDLAEAEVAFRSGEHRKAEALASQAARRLLKHPLSSRAYVRAGHGALHASREAQSIDYFQLARTSARNAREQREALFGLYSAMSELELPEASAALDELNAIDVVDTPDDLLRSQAIRLIHATRVGSIQEAIVDVRNELHVLKKARNPLITTSFLHSFSNALSLGGHYDEALESSEELHQLVKQHRLDFARPYAYIDRAVARIGRREFPRALQDLESVRGFLPPNGDVHIEGNLASIHCRLLIAIGRAREAANQAGAFSAEEPPTAPLKAEILISWAAALACASDKREALSVLAQAEKASATSLVARVLGPAVLAICASSDRERQHNAERTWRAAQETGNFDSLVAAYRGHPQLMLYLANAADGNLFVQVVERAKDIGLARDLGLQVPRYRARRQPLTPRETEVINLIAAGLSNKEAAKALFVAEATIKVHLRHIYEKLGVRGRTAAVAKWLAPR
jgi:ATP/maltotriose-dependent transcriptional regulator MalT